MDEIPEVASPFAPSSVGNDEATEQRTNTPLKRYVTMVGNSTLKWTCNFGCKPEPYSGTYSRVVEHFLGRPPGQKTQQISVCKKVSAEDKAKMKAEVAEAKRHFPGLRRTRSVSSPILEASNASTSSMPVEASSKDETDGMVARFFYGCGIPLNIAKSPLWVDMVHTIKKAPTTYEPPSLKEIKTTLLDKEKTIINQELISIKKKWLTYGVTIVSNGWMNVVEEPFINIMAVSEKSVMHITSQDCSEDGVSSKAITDILLKAIESVGASNVVQILTNNVPECKAAGRVIETFYPHILWSASLSHTLSLLLKDILESVQPSLASLGDCYKMVKDVTEYFCSHSLSLDILRSFSDLDVFLVKNRRYGQQFLIMDRFLQMENILTRVVLSAEWDKIRKGHSKSVLGVEMVRTIILDEDFWKTLKTIVTFIRPIWDLTLYCDSGRSCIGEVYQKLEDMVVTLEIMPFNYPDTKEAILCLVNSLWDKIDVRLYALAYALNPHYYSEKWMGSLTPAGCTRMKPHARQNVCRVYLDALERLVRNPNEAFIVREQMSEFVSDTGTFDCRQSKKDRDHMSAIGWWHLYGARAPELYSLAIKVLSQSTSTIYGEREMATCDYIRGVNKKKVNAGRAETLVHVHYNHRLLTRKRDDYDGAYENWDCDLADENLEIDVIAAEDKECARLYGVETSPPLSHSPSGVAGPSSSSQAPQTSTSRVSRRRS